MAEIHAHYTWTADLCVDAYRVALRNSLQHKIRIAIIVVLIALVVLIAIDPSAGDMRGFGWIMALAAAVVLATSRPARNWWIRRRFAKRPDANASMSVVFGDDGLKFDMPGIAKSEAAWASVYKALLSADGLLLYSNERMFHWLPRDAFASAEDFAAARALIEANVARVKSAK
jgi:hypothetical protein